MREGVDVPVETVVRDEAVVMLEEIDTVSEEDPLALGGIIYSSVDSGKSISNRDMLERRMNVS